MMLTRIPPIVRHDIKAIERASDKNIVADRIEAVQDYVHVLEKKDWTLADEITSLLGKAVTTTSK